MNQINKFFLEMKVCKEFNIEYYIYSSIPSKYLIVSSRKLVLDFVRKYLQKCGF